MVGSSFPMEDQTGEDFFDNLVDDEVDEGVGVGSQPTILDNMGSNDAQAFSKLRLEEVGTSFGDGTGNVPSFGGEGGEMGLKDDTFLTEFDGKEEDMGFEEGGGVKMLELSEPSTAPVSSGCDVIAESANAGGAVKEVQWSAFGGLDDDSVDPFREVAGGFAVASDSPNSVDPSGGRASEFAVASETSSLADPSGGGAGGFVVASSSSVGVSVDPADSSSSFSLPQNVENVPHGFTTADNAAEMQDQNSSQYWENLYPGWRYDPNTGQWHHVDSPNTTVNNTEDYSALTQSTCETAFVEQQSDAYYMQQATPSIASSMTEQGATDNLAYWNQPTQGNTEYPAHMIFDPQYPGWYYDTNAQEWRSLDSYSSSTNRSVDQNQQLSNGSVSTANYYSNEKMGYGQVEQVSTHPHQQVKLGNNHHHEDMNIARVGNNETGNSDLSNGYMSNGQFDYTTEHRTGVPLFTKSDLYEQSSQGSDSGNGVNRFQGYSNGVTSLGEPLSSNHNMEYNQQFSSSYFNSQSALNFSQQPLQNSSKLPYPSSEGRSSAGRPPHALVTFGFGGKLIVLKDQSHSCVQPAYTSQDSAGSVISVLDLMEVAMQKSDGAHFGFDACVYFLTLCQQSFPGPLVSGNVGSKELNRWIDDRISNCATLDADCKNGEVLKMLYSLLKIACQYYGRLRSAYGSDLGSKEHDCPESALARLFASGKRNTTQFNAVSHCLQNLPSEGDIQATAENVQMLLVSGRKMEALQCAQEGHLWGLAVVIAALLGEQFYGETVKQMALHQLVAGSPLRTLCLLLAGQPAEVFSNTSTSDPQGGNVSQPSQVGPNCMLDDWEENLAIVAANRTKGDELVITHLGDCLWRDKGEVRAAHICYLIAEANMESFSESARLCLIGADHLKYPRTFASPEAIQRTELYEYAKVLGNSQFILLPFQSYKLIYACMLAEVGKLTDSLKYCQSVLKALRVGRSVEVDACRQMVSSLEERIKVHQQGGYATNLAPAKLVGRLLNFFDNTAHRVVGGISPPVPSASQSNGPRSDLDHQSRGPGVSSSQSTMAMSTLVPSAAGEGSGRLSLHNRSISEPVIGRTPRKVESQEKCNSTSPHDNNSASGSRFGRFGSQFFQKTVGLVLKSRSDRQAKLGEKNKFYYDEKLKRWVEEGSETPAEEPSLAPPPTTASFMNGFPDHEKIDQSVNGVNHVNGSADLNYGEKKGGTPPIAFGTNHFSAGGRMGVRARYVDTFNRAGGTQPNLYQSPSPSVPAIKPATSNAKFFIPAPVSVGQGTDSTQSSPDAVVMHEDAPAFDGSHPFSSPKLVTPSPTMHRHPSMERIAYNGTGSMSNGNGSLPPHGRRTLSWSGGVGVGDSVNYTRNAEIRTLGEALGYSPSTYMSSAASPGQFSSNCTTVAEDLQEVEL